ncbi:hypothetical protein X874_13720 [Mannheimia varigena USDA-ARS-USMARC-1312]|nr:hypothetical protein X874_13720 [Mannheimia varigena USDA-ARS-USMARC-1312]AHG79246.1 hypothetical protein X875_6280 [Mannheimia varigena USDA-ARS-USMARC-1388]
MFLVKIAYKERKGMLEQAVKKRKFFAKNQQKTTACII